MANVGVIGAGSWGTALSVLLDDNGHQVTIWSIDPEEVKMLDEQREHAKKLPGVKLSDKMVITGNLQEAIEGKDVLIVEDIIDSGRTLYYLIDILKKRNPKSVHLCTLLDKPERRVKDVKVDYVGFNIPDEFVVGYGLDYAQKYRNLPFIGVVEGLE